MKTVVKLVAADHSFVYLMQSQRTSTDWYKIGYSRDSKRRALELNEELPGLDWEVVDAVMCPDEDEARKLENNLHQVFKHRRALPNREWFLLEEAEVRFIRTFFEHVNQRLIVQGDLHKLRQEVYGPYERYKSPIPAESPELPASPEDQSFSQLLCDDWPAILHDLESEIKLIHIYQYVEAIDMCKVTDDPPSYEAILFFDDRFDDDFILPLLQEVAADRVFLNYMRFRYEVDISFRISVGTKGPGL